MTRQCVAQNNEMCQTGNPVDEAFILLTWTKTVREELDSSQGDQKWVIT
jgi:hypothetical protein